jgi:hypothetical protein
MRSDGETDLGRGPFVQGAVLVERDDEGPVEILSHDPGCSEDDVVRLVCFAIGRLELGQCQLRPFVISNRNARPAQIIRARTFDSDLQRDVATGIHLIGRDLYRADVLVDHVDGSVPKT